MRWSALTFAPFLAWAGVSSADVISLRADVWCPYTCTPKSPSGYMIDIAREAFAAAGHTLDYKNLRWKAAIVDTRNNKFNAIVGATVGDAPDFVFPDVSLGQSSVCLFTRADSSWEYKNIDSLKESRLGIARGYAYSPAIDEYIKAQRSNTKALMVAGTDIPLELHVKRVVAKEIDTFVEDESVVNYYLKQTGQSALIRKAGCDKQEPVYVAFSPNNPKSKEYAALVAAAVKDMRKKGRLREILAGYGLTDWSSESEK